MRLHGVILRLSVFGGNANQPRFTGTTPFSDSALLALRRGEPFNQRVVCELRQVALDQAVLVYFQNRERNPISWNGPGLEARASHQSKLIFALQQNFNIP